MLLMYTMMLYFIYLINNIALYLVCWFNNARIFTYYNMLSKELFQFILFIYYIAAKRASTKASLYLFEVVVFFLLAESLSLFVVTTL